eukprot:6207867-Pleurochrysis_carterae.AAC.5
MVEQQQATIDKALKYETFVLKVDPNFHIPDVHELKAPMQPPIDSVGEVVAKMKSEVPKAYDSQLDSFEAKLVTCKFNFMVWVFIPVRFVVSAIS